MSWRQFLKPVPEVLRVKRVLSPPTDTHKTLKTLKTPEIEIENTPRLHKTVQSSEPSWQRDFCEACGDFNNWRGCCPLSIDECLLSRVLDCEGNINELQGIELGQGVTTDQVLDTWLGSGEPVADLFMKPVWLFCIAEHLTKGK